jgi:uncharacterized protein YndB with AHSA1/START domain/DNA-binding transcriptional ArsR family regulator
MVASSAQLQRAIAAVGEPTRFRIVELLATRAHTIGELGAALGALQPQATRHIQALEAAGVVTVHRLGRRRVARLNRETLAALAGYFGSLSEAEPDDADLEVYARAISKEEARGSDESGERTLQFERTYPIHAEDLWAAWTDPAIAATWWAPRHFTVTVFELAPHAGSSMRIALREGDGAEYESAGRVEEVGTGRLVFWLAPLDTAHQPLFQARHTLTITGTRPATMTLHIEVSDLRAGAAPAVAGLEPGWQQLLDNLERILTTEPDPQASADVQGRRSPG